MLTVGRNSYVTFQDNQSPFGVQWRPAGTEYIRVKRRLRVSQPSVLCIAVASSLNIVKYRALG